MFGVKSRNCGTLEASKPPTIPIFQVIWGKNIKMRAKIVWPAHLYLLSIFPFPNGGCCVACVVKRWVRNPNMVLAKEQVGITFLHLGSLTPSLIVNSKQIPLEL